MKINIKYAYTLDGIGHKFSASTDDFMATNGRIFGFGNSYKDAEKDLIGKVKLVLATPKPKEIEVTP